MEEMSQQLLLCQEQILSQEMIQRLELLQMTTMELWEFVERTALENPVIELENPRPSVPMNRSIYPPPRDKQDVWQDEPADIWYRKSGITLAEYLKDQIPSSYSTPAMQFLLHALDGNGWLSEPLEELAGLSGLPLSALEDCLSFLQTLEPAGIGARSLSECLLLQLRREPDIDKAL